MNPPAKIAAFVAVVLAVGGGAAAVGSIVDPDGADEDAGHGAAAESHDGGHAAERAPGEAAEGTLPGLASESGGYRLALARTETRPDARAKLTFTVLGADGMPVRHFDVEHEKRLHLIVVRRDLGSFEHLHPEQARDGSWTARADLAAAGTYRVYTDFTVDGEQHTLGTDLQVPGDYTPRALPEPVTEVTDDRGLTVRLRRDGDRRAFQVLRDGEVVDDELEPYLGAKGHLVTLRAADLAYLHTHPEGDELAFAVELPGPGAYRHHVQFRLDGRIHTATFTEQQS